MLAWFIFEFFCPTQHFFDHICIEELSSITLIFFITFFVDSYKASVKYERTPALTTLSWDFIGYITLLLTNAIDSPFSWKSLLEDFKDSSLTVLRGIVLFFNSLERVAVNLERFIFLLDQAFLAIDHGLQKLFCCLNPSSEL